MKFKLMRIIVTIFKLNYNKISTAFFRKRGIKIGENCKIYSDISTTESYLITLGDNVTISTNVIFLTHDNSISKISSKYTDIFGKIIIKDNVFIGANTLILPGVEIESGTIIGAGSVVTKSITEKDTVFAGNPAKKICSINQYKEKNEMYGLNITGMNYEEKKELLDNGKLIKK